MRPAHENPFRVERVTRLAYLCDEIAWDTIMLRVRAANFRGALVGEEGSGKSTLLVAIVEALEADGLRTALIRMSGSATSFERKTAVEQAAASAEQVVAIDGFEQLQWLERRRVARACPRLLVTAHRPAGLSTLISVKPRLNTLEGLLARLLIEVTPATRAFATRAFIKHRGDIRSTLFDCYDAWAEGRIDGVAADSRQQ